MGIHRIYPIGIKLDQWSLLFVVQIHEKPQQKSGEPAVMALYQFYKYL